ncbi:MAG TPA: 30S ribosomal protein S8 [Acidimicrobiales bacterium]|nr:30S ribosomal protein S8 [Acidimicrobiales bacterium]
MTMTDPIADMLTRIRNANTAMFDSVKMPSSKLKESLAQVLAREGYISGYRVSRADGRPGATLEIDLKYSEDRQKTIVGLQRVSRPGLRIYRKSDQMPKVLGGVGVAVVSTSHGLMTDREARKARLGGEVLCYVW